MEATSERESNSKGKEKEKRSGWSAFYNFLAAGGFLLLLVVGVGLAVAISILFK